MKTIFILFFCFLGFGLISCSLFETEEKDDTPPEIVILSPKQNDEVTGIFTIRATVTDNETVSKVVLYIDYEPVDSTLIEQDIYSFNYNSDLLDNGKFDIFIKAYDKSDNWSISEVIAISFINYRIFRFVNTTHDDIHFTFGDYEGTMLSEDSIDVQVEKGQGPTIFDGYNSLWWNYSLGEPIEWYADFEVEDENETYYFWVASDFFFLYLNNTTSVWFDKIEVNKDLSHGYRYVYVNIPNNSLWYTLGFYEAYTNSNVWVHLVNHPQYAYVYWDDLALEWTNNQFVALSPTGIGKSVVMDRKYPDMIIHNGSKNIHPKNGSYSNIRPTEITVRLKELSIKPKYYNLN